MHIVIKGHLDKNVPSDSEKIKIKWDENVAHIFIPFDFWVDWVPCTHKG